MIVFTADEVTGNISKRKGDDAVAGRASIWHLPKPSGEKIASDDQKHEWAQC